MFSDAGSTLQTQRGKAQLLRKLVAKHAPNLMVFRFMHHRKGVQNCRKFVANSKVNFGKFYANTPLAMPPPL